MYLRSPAGTGIEMTLAGGPLLNCQHEDTQRSPNHTPGRLTGRAPSPPGCAPTPPPRSCRTAATPPPHVEEAIVPYPSASVEGAIMLDMPDSVPISACTAGRQEKGTLRTRCQPVELQSRAWTGGKAEEQCRCPEPQEQLDEAGRLLAANPSRPAGAARLAWSSFLPPEAST